MCGQCGHGGLGIGRSFLFSSLGIGLCRSFSLCRSAKRALSIRLFWVVLSSCARRAPAWDCRQIAQEGSNEARRRAPTKCGGERQRRAKESASEAQRRAPTKGGERRRSTEDDAKRIVWTHCAFLVTTRQSVKRLASPGEQIQCLLAPGAAEVPDVQLHPGVRQDRPDATFFPLMVHSWMGFICFLMFLGAFRPCEFE